MSDQSASGHPVAMIGGNIVIWMLVGFSHLFQDINAHITTVSGWAALFLTFVTFTETRLAKSAVRLLSSLIKLLKPH